MDALRIALQVLLILTSLLLIPLVLLHKGKGGGAVVRLLGVERPGDAATNATAANANLLISTP